MPDETRTELQDMTDADLVRLCRQGRHEAFDVIALRYLGVMHAVALARLADRDAAEDLVQEVLLRVFLHLDRLKKPDSLGPWITQITRNMARNWLRDGRTRSEALQLVPLDDVESQLADDRQKGAPKTMQEDETQTAIEKAIMALKPDDRELVLLYYAEEMSQKEIAEKLGVHPATVGRRLDKAFAEMRRTLEPSVREASRTLRPRRRFEARTLVLVASAAALTAKTKTALASTAGATAFAEASAAASAGITWGFLSNIFAAIEVLSKGTLLMSIKAKIAALIALVGLAGGGIYVATHNPSPDPFSKEQIQPGAQQQISPTPAATKPVVQEQTPESDMRLAYVISGYHPGEWINASMQVLSKVSTDSQSPDPMTAILQKLRSAIPEIDKIEGLRLALLIDDPTKSYREEDQIFGLLKLKAGQEISEEALDRYINAMLTGNLELRMSREFGAGMHAFSIRSNSPEKDREIWEVLRREMVRDDSTETALKIRVLAENTFAPFMDKRAERWFRTISHFPLEYQMKWSPDYAMVTGLKVLAHQCQDMEFSISPLTATFLITSGITARPDTSMARYLEACRDEKAAPLLAGLPRTGALRFAFAWDQQGFNAFADDLALKMENQIEMGDTPEQNENEQKLKAQWRDICENQIKPSLPCNSRALAISTLNLGKGLGATYIIARSDNIKALENSMDHALKAFEAIFHKQFRLASGVFAYVDKDGPLPDGVSARLATTTATVGLEAHHFRFYPLEDNPESFNKIIRALAYQKADNPGIGGEYAIIDNTLAFALASESVEMLAGLLKTMSPFSTDAQMPSTERFGDDAMGYIEINPLGIVMWVQQFASRMAQAEKTVSSLPELRPQFALYEPGKNKAHVTMAASNLGPLALALASEGPVLLAFKADNKAPGIRAELEIGPALMQQIIQLIDPSNKQAPMLSRVTWGDLYQKNKECVQKGDTVEFRVRESQWGTVIFTPWCNFLLEDVFTNGAAMDPTIRIAQPGEGRGSGGGSMTNLSLRWIGQDGILTVVANSKLLFEYEDDLIFTGDRTIDVRDRFGGLIYIDLEKLKSYSQ